MNKKLINELKKSNKRFNNFVTWIDEAKEKEQDEEVKRLEKHLEIETEIQFNILKEIYFKKNKSHRL